MNKIDNEERFYTAKQVVLVDSIMRKIIKCGGVSVVAAVFGIFIFIFLQTSPLFQKPVLTEEMVIDLPPDNYQLIGLDEWSEFPFMLNQKNELIFVDLKHDPGKNKVVPLALPEGSIPTVIKYNQSRQEIICGTDDGALAVIDINYFESFDANVRALSAKPAFRHKYQIGNEGYPIAAIEFGDSGSNKFAAAIQDVDGSRRLYAISLIQKNTLFGEGKITVGNRYELNNEINGAPENIRINNQGNILVVTTSGGYVYYFRIGADSCELMQIFQPFQDLDNVEIDSLDFVFGGVSLVLTSVEGVNRIFSLLVPETKSSRIFNHTKTMSPLPDRQQFYASSLRNKIFLLGTQSYISLRYATTEEIRWEKHVDYEITDAAISAKYDKILILDSSHKLRIITLNDPHPEAGFKAYFSKLWYEGASFPKYEWQSTGGTDEYEPKMSMIPLICGTLKGTFYAMIFASPIALLAAVYTSQFLNFRYRAIVKPTMEIMASLPSVVLGFLAALWLAPIFEDNIVFVFVTLITLPVSVMLFTSIWARIPGRLTKNVHIGCEYIILFAVIAVCAVFSWFIAPVVEGTFFSVADPLTNVKIANFTLWVSQFTDTPFEQRNAVLVGFVMGFAVIPIIFSIAEDSLSNVPRSLTSPSMALGASRWQTCFRVVIPTASAGIFSGLIIGLGRAVGETMIVLMATGNTPVMNFDMFSGMRTLSANIAVELPEAPYKGTLYRTLFFSATILFIFTFILNTVAEVLRQFLRKKYKTI